MGANSFRKCWGGHRLRCAWVCPCTWPPWVDSDSREPRPLWPHIRPIWGYYVPSSSAGWCPPPTPPGIDKKGGWVVRPPPCEQGGGRWIPLLPPSPPVSRDWAKMRIGDLKKYNAKIAKMKENAGKCKQKCKEIFAVTSDVKKWYPFPTKAKKRCTKTCRREYRHIQKLTYSCWKTILQIFCIWAWSGWIFENIFCNFDRKKLKNFR